MAYYLCTRIKMPGALGPGRHTDTGITYYLERVQTSVKADELDALREEIFRGRYKHYKGGRYDVIELALLGNRAMIYYRAVDGSGWLRPADEWFDLVPTEAHHWVSRFIPEREPVSRGHYRDPENGHLYFVFGEGEWLPDGQAGVIYRRLGPERDYRLRFEPVDDFLAHGWKRTELGRISQGVGR